MTTDMKLQPEVNVKEDVKKPARVKKAEFTMRNNFRIYPNVDQKELLNKFMSHCRVVYNDYVYQRRQNNNRVSLKDGTNIASLVTAQAKKTEERSWLAETPAVPLQQSVRDAQSAYSNHYDSKSGARKGNAVGKPRFKKKDIKSGALRFVGEGFKVRQTNKRRAMLKLTGIDKEITVHLSRDLPAHVSSATVMKKSDGTWWVSFVIDVDKKPAPHTKRMVGIDVGSHDLATLVTADGERWKTGNPRIYASLRKNLALADQSLARSVKGSARYEKKRIHRANIYAKMVRIRKDWQRTLAAQIADEFRVIVVEKLSAKQLIEKTGIEHRGARKRNQNRAFHDNAWGDFLNALENAATLRGREFKAVDPRNTTRECSVCGVNGGKKEPGIRHWTCDTCGSKLDRDYNAAVNILQRHKPRAISKANRAKYSQYVPGDKGKVTNLNLDFKHDIAKNVTSNENV